MTHADEMDARLAKAIENGEVVFLNETAPCQGCGRLWYEDFCPECDVIRAEADASRSC
jgi:hypothetical protein